jgi:hypothetical protein
MDATGPFGKFRGFSRFGSTESTHHTNTVFWFEFLMSGTVCCCELLCSPIESTEGVQTQLNSNHISVLTQLRKIPPRLHSSDESVSQ